MDSYGIRELQRRPSEIIGKVETTGRPALVTRYGKLAAVLRPIDSDAFEDYVLANAPEFVASMEEADEDARKGRTRPAEEVLAEIEAEEAASRRRRAS